MKLEGFQAEALAEEIDPLIRDGAGFGQIDAEPAQLVGLVAAAQPDDQPALGQVVGKCDIAEQTRGLIQGRQDNGGPQLDAQGLRCDMADHHQR